MKIQINALDKLFSQVIRLKAKGICEIGGEFRGYERLMCCHNWGRRKKSVRWDLDNAIAGCFYHHRIIDENAEDKIAFFKRYLGEQRYENLNKRANWPQQYKPDTKLIKLMLEKEIQKYATLSD